MKAVYKMDFDCGRMGNLVGLFIADKKWVEGLIESEVEVYFGEVLGKHSEVYGKITKEELTFVSDSPEVIKVIEEHELESGYNPFDYDTMNGKSVADYVSDYLNGDK